MDAISANEKKTARYDLDFVLLRVVRNRSRHRRKPNRPFTDETSTQLRMVIRASVVNAPSDDIAT